MTSVGRGRGDDVLDGGCSHAHPLFDLEPIVRLDIVAGEEGKSTPFTFNGLFSGKPRVTIPKGWLVLMVFTNNSDIPHTLTVAVPRFMLKPCNRRPC